MAEKVMNFFWGNNTMSWLRYMTVFSFRKYNPDWKIVIHFSDHKISDRPWNSLERQDFHIYDGKDYRYNLSTLEVEEKEYNIVDKNGNEITPSQKSNFFKWNMLATEGNFYADMDILFLRSINDMYDKTKEFNIGLSFTRYYSIGFMFSNGNNQFFKEVYDQCFNNFDEKSYQGAGVFSLSKWPNISDIQNQYGKVYNIPFILLYQFNSEIVPQIHQKNSTYMLSPDVIGLHWYAGYPLSQKANGFLNENNYKESNTLLTRTLSQILD